MDPIRRKLVELRDRFDFIGSEPCLCGTPDGEISCPYCTEIEQIRAEFDAILADCDAADEIRPTQCEAKDQERDDE